MQARSCRVAAIHDLSCFGRSSLTVVMPLFAKMNIQVAPLPTALLSTHGAFPGGTFLDLTDQMKPIIDHWQKLEVEFDAIYSGFLGSGDQIDIVLDFIERFKGDNRPMVVVDPVMGDEGELYSIIDNSIVDKMVDLVKGADIITPNTTEAFVLLNREYNPVMNQEDAKEVMMALSELGPEIIVLTSIHFPDKEGRYTGIFDKKKNKFFFDSCRYFPYDYSGTGDAFTTVFTGALLKGASIKEALSSSISFIENSLQRTIELETDPNDGINLEAVKEVIHGMD